MPATPDTAPAQTQVREVAALRTPVLATTPEDQAVTAAANKVVEKLTAADPTASPEFKDKQDVVAMSDAEAERAIMARFEAERDGDGNLILLPQRADESIQLDHLVRTLALGKFEDLDPNQRDIVTREISAIMDLLPTVSAMLPAGSDERKFYIKAFIKDPKNVEYRRNLAAKEKEVIETPPTAEAIAAARDRVAQLEIRRQALSTEASRTQDEIEIIDRELREFEEHYEDRDQPDGSVKAEKVVGVKLARMRVLEEELALPEAEIALLNTQITPVETAIAKFEARKLETLGKLQGLPAASQMEATRELSKEEEILRGNLSPLMQARREKEQSMVANQTELTRLKIEKDDLTKKQTKATEKWNKLIVGKDGVESEYAQLEDKLRQANETLGNVIGGTDTLPQTIRQTIGSTFRELMEQRFRDDAQSAREVIDGMATKTEDPYKNALLHELKEGLTQTVEVGRIRTHLSKEEDAGRIREVYGNLLTSGPEQVIRDMLGRAGYSPAEIDANWTTLAIAGDSEAQTRIRLATAHKFTQPEIDAKMQDATFVADGTSTAAEYIIAARMRTGTITTQESNYIAGTEWGQNAITGALALNDQRAATIRQLMPGVTSGNLKDKLLLLKDHPKSLLLLLLTVFGGAAFLPVGIAAGAMLLRGGGGSAQAAAPAQAAA